MPRILKKRSQKNDNAGDHLGCAFLGNYIIRIDQSGYIRAELQLFS
jgi:hypothetical protein